MTKRSLRPLPLLGAAAVAVAIAACGSSASGSSGGSVSSKTLKIGIAVDQTGTYSFAGVPSKQGATLAVDQINAAGGINGRKLALINGDASSDQNQTKQLMTKYASESDVIAILGPSGSAVAPAVAPLVKALKIPAIGPTVSSPDYTNNNPWTYKMGLNPDIVGKTLCKIIAARKLKRIAIMVTRDNAGQVGYKDTVDGCIGSTGAKLVATQSATDATDDYSSYVSNIKNSNPDGILTLLSGQRSAQFEVQARSAGIPTSVGFYGPNTVTGSDFLSIGKASVDGTVGVTEYFPGQADSVNKGFVAAYTKRFGAGPDNYAAQGYASVELLKLGLMAAGKNVSRASVRDGMDKVANQPTVMGTGKLTITPQHISNYGIEIVQVKNGKIVKYTGPGA